MQQTFSQQPGQRIAVVTGLRTPFAKQATDLHGATALQLGTQVVNELLWRSDLDPDLIQQLVFGQVIQMSAAPNIAREIVLASRLGVQTDAYSVSRACATSFQSIANVAQAIAGGAIEIGIAGGADSSSVLPIGLSQPLAKTLLDWSKARDWRGRINTLRGLSLRDLLPQPPAIAEYSTGLTMGAVAEQMAQKYRITREAQDELAHHSHLRAAAAWSEGKLAAETFPLAVAPFKTLLERDNNVRFDSELSRYAVLKPAFDRRLGTVTAGNSTPLTDGAAAVLLMREDRALALGLQPLGFLRSLAFSAIDAREDMLLGPAYATPKALAAAGVGLADLTLIEMHEAFAAQVLANLHCFGSNEFAQQLGLTAAIGEVDRSKLNVLGGSIAYGHPFAATGARMVTQVLHEVRRRGGGLALTTACAAGGLGAAMVWEVA